jgi:hypothetical protein
MRALQRLWEDIRRGENIDLYVTVTIAIVLVVLNVVGIAPQTWVAPLILAVLALLSIATLGNRYRLETVLQNMNQTAGRLLLGSYPSNLESDVENAKELWIVGISLYATTIKYYSSLESKLKKGCSIRVLLVNPDGQSVQMAAMRKYGLINVEDERTRIRTSLQRLCELQKGAKDRLEIRTLDNPLTFGAFAIDPETSGGVLYVEHYGFKTRRDHVRKLVLHRNDEGWYNSIKTEIYDLWKSAIEWKCQD